VDADLRRPKLRQLFKLPWGEGLTGSLLDESVDGKLQKTALERLMVLPSGDLPHNPAEVIDSPRLRKLLEDLAKKVDLVLIDCPPVLPVSDASILASQADGVVLVLQADETRRQAAREAVESLRKVGAHLVGVVLNSARNHKEDYYKYYGMESKQELSRLERWKESLAAVAKQYQYLRDKVVKPKGRLRR
jgi:capsular exopolysaccharide synthesis family protein